MNDSAMIRLHEAVVQAGLPLVSVRSKGGVVEIILADAATREQREQAAAILAGFDARPRRERTVTALLSAINALSAADRNRLLALAAADLLQRQPGAARALGIELDGDEVDG